MYAKVSGDHCHLRNEKSSEKARIFAVFSLDFRLYRSKHLITIFGNIVRQRFSVDTSIYSNKGWHKANQDKIAVHLFWVYSSCDWGARWLSGRVSDSGARGPGFETYRRRVVSLSKTLYSPKVLVNYPGSDGSVPT